MIISICARGICIYRRTGETTRRGMNVRGNERARMCIHVCACVRAPVRLRRQLYCATTLFALSDAYSHARPYIRAALSFAPTQLRADDSASWKNTRERERERSFTFFLFGLCVTFSNIDRAFCQRNNHWTCEYFDLGNSQ